jgi:hypothetical protein
LASRCPHPSQIFQDHRKLAQDVGFSERAFTDAATATLPSHMFTTPSQIDLNYDSGVPAIRAALTLRWLHQTGYLKYYYMSFDSHGSD